MTSGWTVRVIRGLWADRMRFLAAGGIALLLWFLLGEKVNDQEPLPLDVQVLTGDEVPRGSGLFVRVPPNLAFTEVAPPRVEVVLSGPRAELSRLENVLRGFFDVPADFIGDQKSDRRVLRVVGDFRFPQLESVRVDIVNRPEILLGLARREGGRITLGRANLRFDPPMLAEGIEVEFEPSFLKLSGPQGQIQALKDDPSLFQLASIGREELEIGLEQGLSLLASQGKFASEALHRLDFAEGGRDLIRIRFERRLDPYRFTLESVEVAPLVPPAARREGMRKENPITLDPETVRVEVAVPKDAFETREDARRQVLRDLNLFVDLGDMPFSTFAQHLPVRFEGLPAGSTVVVDPPQVDTHWNEAETTEEPE